MNYIIFNLFWCNNSNRHHSKLEESFHVWYPLPSRYSQLNGCRRLSAGGCDSCSQQLVAPLTLLYNINAGHEEVDIVNVAWWLDYFGRRTLDGCSLRSVLVRRSSRVSWPRHDATSWYKTKIQKRGGPQTKSINRLKKWQKMGRIQGVASDSHILVPRVNDT